LRHRWFGATGRRVPQIAVDGELDVDGALVLDAVDDAALRAAFDEGRPVVVRADTPDRVLEALRRPEVSAALVPPGRRDLLELDLIGLTYG
jgi:predicted secreted protein